MEEVIACATNDRRFMTDKQIKGALGKVGLEEYKNYLIICQKMLEKND